MIQSLSISIFPRWKCSNPIDVVIDSGPSASWASEPLRWRNFSEWIRHPAFDDGAGPPSLCKDGSLQDSVFKRLLGGPARSEGKTNPKRLECDEGRRSARPTIWLAWAGEAPALQFPVSEGAFCPAGWGKGGTGRWRAGSKRAGGNTARGRAGSKSDPITSTIGAGGRAGGVAGVADADYHTARVLRSATLSHAENWIR